MLFKFLTNNIVYIVTSFTPLLFVIEGLLQMNPFSTFFT